MPQKPRQVPSETSVFMTLRKNSHVAVIPKKREKLSDPYGRQRSMSKGNPREIASVDRL